MKTAISAGLLAHYAAGTTTLATCWKVTLTNATVLCFTSHDADLVIDGLSYEAKGGYTSSAIKQQTRLATDNLDTHGFLSSDRVTSADLRSGLWDYAEVEIFCVNYANLVQGKDVLARGKLGEISHERNTFRAELRGLNNAYGQAIGQIYQPSCRASLGDARCGVNIAALAVTGTVASVSADGLVLFDAARTEPGPAGGKVISGITRSTAGSKVTTINSTAHGFLAGRVVVFSGIVGTVQLNGRTYVLQTVATNSYTISEDTSEFTAYVSGGLATPQGDVGTFDYGKITMTSGLSIGLGMEVKSYLPGQIALQMQMPQGVMAGDTYSMTPGCGRRFAEDCVTKFANGLNFRGEPHIPGMDRLIQVGAAL